MIDKYGKYAVTVHYQMTYKALLKLGYSRKEADIIAHYSSTYSDHPTNSVLHADVTLHGNTTMRQVGYRPTIDYRRTVNSQGEENSMWHSMMSDEEAKNGMTEREAMQRGLEFGWNNVFEYATSKEKKDLGKLGQGLHALQDAIAHEGVKTNDHLGKNWSSAKKLANDMYGGTYEASNLTRSALIVNEVLQGNTSNLRNGDKLDVRGMSKEQFNQFMQVLLQYGFKGTLKDEQ